MTDKKNTTQSGGKTTIYVDVDDEITAVIDKVKHAEQKIIALVLPKRASVLQSVVNMKLLKKAAVSAKKNIVLITSETALLPLAGAAGLHVARSLSSKPVIPPPPKTDEDTTEEMVAPQSDEPSLDKRKSVGELAAATAARDDDVIELDNTQVGALPPDATKSRKPKKLKALKVPNFERFRLGVVLAVLGAVLLVVGWALATVVLPKANVTIRTNTTTLVSSFDFTASTEVTELDVEGKKIPAKLKEVKKTDNEKSPATGEKNNGEKAEGTVVLRASDCTLPADTPNSVPAGSTVTSGGKSFVTQNTLTFSLENVGSCVNYKTNSGDIVATEPGESFNLANGSSFTVANRSGLTGTGSASGGTDDIIKIVTQKDIDDAVGRITERQGTGAADELKAALESEGLYALTETLKGNDPKLTPSIEVGQPAAEVSVSYEASFTMLGINREDLSSVIKKDVEAEIDSERQVVTDDGIDAANMRINNNTEPGEAFLNFRTSVVAGPQLDEAAIKEAVRGKKRGEVENYIDNLPGVDEVVVEYEPFWVMSTPKAAKKINIIIEKEQ